MFLTKQNNILFISVLILVVSLSGMIQYNLFLHWDISFLLNTARQLLAGGKYIHDFFTPNTPMSLYLYVPPVILNQLSGINSIFIFRIYIYLIISISFFICFYISKYIFLPKDILLRQIFLITLIAILTILPLFDFGQRDHLFFIFAMPYLLLVVMRLQGHSIPLPLAMLIGLLAGLGFAIKPQFLITPILLEAYFIFYKQNWLGWARAEIFIIIALLMFYTLAVFIFHRDYVFTIIPYMLHSYYQSINEPWSDLVLNNFVCFGIFTLLFYFVRYKENDYELFLKVLALALVGFFLSYLTQRTLFYYHILPFFSASILLFTIVLGLFIRKNYHIFIVLLGLIVYIYPVYVLVNQYQVITTYKKIVLDKLIIFMHTQPAHQSIYVLSFMNYASSLVEYAGAKTAQRFDSLWMVKGLIQQKIKHGESVLHDYFDNDTDEYFFVNIIADDLHKNKPDLVFVDVHNTFLFDYLRYFLENKRFRSEWKSYYLLTTVFSTEENQQKYQLFQVYKHF